MLLIAAIVLAPSRVVASDQETQADVLTAALPAAAFLLTVGKDDDDGKWALVKSVGAATAGTLALNALIDKDSPNGASDNAFPSGHSTVAFSSAAFIQRRYGLKPGIPAYVAASYVGWLRVETDDHDAADVFAGAALGILSAYLFTQPFGDDLEIAAFGDGATLGLSWRYRW